MFMCFKYRTYNFMLHQLSSHQLFSTGSWLFFSCIREKDQLSFLIYENITQSAMFCLNFAMHQSKKGKMKSVIFGASHEHRHIDTCQSRPSIHSANTYTWTYQTSKSIYRYIYIYALIQTQTVIIMEVCIINFSLQKWRDEIEA